MTTALVTGASSGIGRAIALDLAEAGHDVIAVARDARKLEALATEQPGITPLALDVTDRAACAAALDGRVIDVLVNNAGMMPPLGAFADALIEDVDRTVSVNIAAVLAITRLVVPGMRARGRGDVFFMSSAAAHIPYSDMAVYAASKAALSRFAACLRTELAPHGIRVTEIAPGRVQTHLYDEVLDDAARAAMYSGARPVQPEDVAQMVRAVLALPEWATVSRFDIVTTCPTTPTRPQVKK